MFNWISERSSPSILKDPTDSRILAVSSSVQSSTFLLSSTLAFDKIVCARLFPIPNMYVNDIMPLFCLECQLQIFLP